MRISSIFLILAIFTVLAVGVLNQFQIGRELFGDKGAFVISSITASALSGLLSYKVGYSLDALDLKGRLSGLALFLWLMFAFDFVFQYDFIFNDTGSNRASYIVLLGLSPVLFLYYTKAKTGKGKT
tara:strand:- start:559 stop:936 length:378 start_codon:yes stop_codon:yes gene_type:complete